MSAENRPDEDLGPAGEAGSGAQSETSSGAGDAPHDDGAPRAHDEPVAVHAPEDGPFIDDSVHTAPEEDGVDTRAAQDHEDTPGEGGDDALADARAFADSVLAGLEEAGLLAAISGNRAEARTVSVADADEPSNDPKLAEPDKNSASFTLAEEPSFTAAPFTVPASDAEDEIEASASMDQAPEWGASYDVGSEAVFAGVALFPDEAPSGATPQDPDAPAGRFDGDDDSGGGDMYDAPLAAEKHDALADAVQAALLAVYGGQGYGVQSAGATGADPSPFTHEPARETEDSLPSPEDVILNYFQYTSQAQTQADFQDAAPAEAPLPYRNGRGDTGTAGVQAAASAYSSAASAPRFEGQAAPNVSFAAQSAAATPPPLPFANLPVPAPAAETEIRANSKLLGAAGLGLIGGIAFAAVVAVFLINSMEPEEQPRVAAIRQPALAPLPETVPAAPARPEVVAGDVAGSPGAAVPLNIEVRALPRNEQTLVSITGIPAGARLNSGVDAGGGNWLLPPRRLNGLTLSLPAELAGPVEIGVEILDSNVRVPLSEKRTFTVALNGGAGASQAVADAQPAPAASLPAAIREDAVATPTAATAPAAPLPAAALSQQLAAFSGAQAALPGPATPAPPAPAALPQTAAISPMPAGDVQDLIREGNRYMREGDILRAREFYELAVRSGNAEAALAMGRSFDPSYFDRLDLKSGEPDPAKAFEWYREAMNAGLDRAAQVRIENLRRFLNR